MNLPISAPLEPMLAKRADALPEGEGWLYEPKWDGFRVILFRDGDEWLMQSRDKKPLNRYFPELQAPILTSLPRRCVLDGEVVITAANGLDFEALSLRIHPAASRVAALARERPASMVFWDLLALDARDLSTSPFAERRTALEQALGELRAPLYLTPATRDRALAEDWFQRFEGAGLDGVMAKRERDVYQPKKRAMLKIKHERTADCVVAGLRWHKNGPGTLVGSLLLGLHDEAGRLHHVGVAASFKSERRRELAEELAPLRDGADQGHPWLGVDPNQSAIRVPGATSRWSKGKELSFEPLRLERVCEVTYDHMEGTRFRHTAHFKRWRPDKPVGACGFDQLEVTPAYELGQIFGA
jgi:ATP-dependent DNA ligase